MNLTSKYINAETDNLELEIAKGNIDKHSSLNKFGLAPDGLQTTATDIWDRANSSATQQIWVAPTEARIHTITSSNTQDDGTPEGAGSGAQAVRIYGLTSWTTDEVSEDVILNGTANVNTVNSYVIIYRMKIISVGDTYQINAGNITATATTDATITAQINIGEGQTNMAIFAIPSTKTIYINKVVINCHDSANPATATEGDFKLLVNENPNKSLTVFLTKANIGLNTSGSSSFERKYNPPLKIAGPAIIKIQGVSTSADTEASAEFDGIIVED